MDRVKIIYYGSDKKLTEILNKEKAKCVDQPEKVSFEHFLPDQGHLILNVKRCK